MSREVGVLVVLGMGMRSSNLMPEKIVENYRSTIKGLPLFLLLNKMSHCGRDAKSA